LTRLEDEHGDDLRVVFRHFPLISIHDKAQLAAEAAEAAGAQGAFWEMHDRIFENQRQWSSVNPDQAREMFIGYAADLGLDTERFAADLEEGTYQDVVMASYQEAVAQELSGTPTFFFNGQPFEAPLSYFWLDAFVRLELLARNQFTAPPAMVIDPQKQYQATIKTDKGDIVLALDAQSAPLTVNNFVFLAREGWYDGVTFFRVLPGFVAQSGDPTDTGLGGPGYELPAEIGLLHEPGAIAMARRSDQVNPERLSSGSQFYIALDALPQLDGAYTVFGYVREGLDVALALSPRDPSQNPELPPGDKIITIEIKELTE
jgi:cyclophilin family peptidyl-prolyl cis-trans isomerase